MAAPVKNIFAKNNRGILLDVVVFVLQLILIRLLTRYFIELIHRASGHRIEGLLYPSLKT
jgi:hypothetical protein